MLPPPPAPIGSAERSSLVEALRHGWSGDFGTIEVDERGAAIALRSCRDMTQDPKSCPEVKAEGRLQVKKWSFVVGATEFVAFVDGRGGLHVAPKGAVVAKLGADRSGTVALSYFVSLTVGETCSVAAGGRQSPVPCRFEEREGRSWFVAMVGGVNHELVYLPDEQILASPALVRQVLHRP